MPKTIHTRRNLSKKPTKRSITSKRGHKTRTSHKPRKARKTRKNVPRRKQAKTRRLSLKKLMGGGFNEIEYNSLTTVLNNMNLFTKKEISEINNELGLIAYFYSGDRFEHFIEEITRQNFKNKKEFMFWLKMKIIHLQYDVETDIDESDFEDAENDESENENDVGNGYMEDDGMKLEDYEDDDGDHYNPKTYYKNDKKTIKTLINYLQTKL